MTHPLTFRVLLLCAIECLFILLCQAEAERKFNAGGPRLVAISDLHGDISACRDVLRAAEIIDKEDHWIAGQSTVVQLGDIADRGSSPHEIYDLFFHLEVEAKKEGGEFIFLIGNHEFLGLLGDLRYVHKSVLSRFGGRQLYASVFGPTGAYGSVILRHPVVVVRDGVVFVHACIVPAFATRGVDALNSEFQKPFQNISLLSLVTGRAGKGRPTIAHPFEAMNSPLWSRRPLHEAAAGHCAMVDESLRRLSRTEAEAGRPPVRVMIGGHTIQQGGKVAVLCGGRLVAADVGLSRYLQDRGGHMAFVEFVWDNASGNKVRVPQPQYPFGVNYKAAKVVEEEARPRGPINSSMKVKNRQATLQNEVIGTPLIFFLSLIFLLAALLTIMYRLKYKKKLRRYRFWINRKQF